MSIEEDFAFLRAWLSERGGERAKAALDRIEEYVRSFEIQTGANANAVRELINERDALKAALDAGLAAVMDERDALKAENERLRDALDTVDMLEDARSAYERVKKERDALKAELEKWLWLMERFYPLRDQPDMSVLDMFPGDAENARQALAKLEEK